MDSELEMLRAAVKEPADAIAAQAQRMDVYARAVESAEAEAAAARAAQKKSDQLAQGGQETAKDLEEEKARLQNIVARREAGEAAAIP